MRTAIGVLGLSLAALIAACGTTVVADGQQVRCRNRTINVVQAPGELRVSQELVDMCRGYSLTLRTVPPVDVNRARTRQPSGSSRRASWLDSDANENGEMVITVPDEGIPVGSDPFKYDLAVDNIGRLDPRVRVRP
jgi:hypothetical protein